jgi:hypothetical protein
MHVIVRSVMSAQTAQASPAFRACAKSRIQLCGAWMLESRSING